MSYVKLQTRLLSTRDDREKVLNKVLRSTRESVVFAATAIPGQNKCPRGSDKLFNWLLAAINQTFNLVSWWLPVAYDALGPHAIFSVASSAEVTKYACIGIEESHPVARLLDLDVYDQDYGQIGRADLGIASRRCLLCANEATECIRLLRHSQDLLNECVTCLLEEI
jgi:holo-ACP synthase